VAPLTTNVFFYSLFIDTTVPEGIRQPVPFGPLGLPHGQDDDQSVADGRGEQRQRSIMDNELVGVAVAKADSTSVLQGLKTRPPRKTAAVFGGRTFRSGYTDVESALG
jgi:hypothetical protein